MKHLLKKASRKFGLSINRTISSHNNPYAEFGIEKSEFAKTEKGICLTQLDVVIADNKASDILLRGYVYARNIAEIAKGKFEIKNERLILHVQGLNFEIDEFEELYIINEIFVESCYNIHPVEQSCILVDIGMNVGICSLFFANKAAFKQIYSFEPFKETFDLAKRNFSLNPDISQKIAPHNFGLAKADGTLEVEYSVEARGRMGINGLPPDMSESAREKRNLILKDAASTLSNIFSKHPNECFVLKCDCEGAEYEIFERLHEQNLIPNFNYCIIEWHYKSPQPLVDQLAKSGFTTITTTFEHHNAGIIYAFKK